MNLNDKTVIQRLKRAGIIGRYEAVKRYFEEYLKNPATEWCLSAEKPFTPEEILKLKNGKDGNPICECHKKPLTNTIDIISDGYQRAKDSLLDEFGDTGLHLQLCEFFQISPKAPAEQEKPEAARLEATGQNIVQERKDAEAVLLDKKLIETVQEQLNRRVVGEETSRFTIFMKAAHCFAKGARGLLIVNDESSAGKSYLIKAVCELYPKIKPGDKYEFWRLLTKITDETFAYWHNPKIEPDFCWEGRFLGLQDAKTSTLNSKTFQVMCSDGAESIMVNNQKIMDVKINGRPSGLLVSTAASVPNFETLNRFDMNNLDSSEEQTRAIVSFIAELASSGRKPKYEPSVVNALGILPLVDVVIPFAEKVGLSLPADQLRMRRSINSAFGFIQASAALHQFQRERDEADRVIAERLDYETAQTCFNSLVPSLTGVPFTMPQKKSWEAFKAACESGTLEPNYLAINEIHSRQPIYSEDAWRDALKAFGLRGLVLAKLEEPEGEKEEGRKRKGRKSVIYAPNEHLFKAAKLPEWDSL